MDQSEALADNAFPSGSQMDLTSSTTTTLPKTINRKRLNKQALDILEDHFLRVGQNPSLTEKEALLEKIKAVPLAGCVDYDLIRLSGWFVSRRKRLRMKERRKEQSLLSNNSRFPSLTPAAIQHLTVLASNQLHPSPELLKTWTTLLASSGAIEQDVINWIHHRNQQEQPPALQHTPPTPSDAATTPEPLSAISQSQPQSTFPPSYKQETTSSPLMPVLQLPDEHDDARTTPSEPSSPTSNNNLNQRIIHGVRDALANPPPQTMQQNAAPKTAAEFDALFSPFEQRILLLLHTLEST